MRLTFIFFVCFTLIHCEHTAKPVRVEVEETSKPRRKRIKGDLLNLLLRVSLEKAV